MLQSSLLAQFSAIRHGFSTKADPLPIEPAPWLAKQIHSDQSIVLPTEQGIPSLQSLEADAVVTKQAGLSIAVQTADCVPILLVDLKAKCIAAVHAGWRGTAHHIVTKTIQGAMADLGVKPENISAAIGPCIHAQSYEVDDPVLEEMERTFSITSDVMQPKGDGKYWLDLVAANKRCLHEAGVPEMQVDVIDYCTFEHDELLHSFRREGPKAGRNISWIRLI